MKQMIRGAGALALAAALAACGGAPANPGAGTVSTSPAVGDTAATSPAVGDTAATSPAAGTSPTIAAGDTAATSPAVGDTSATSPAVGDTSATSTAGDTSATSPAVGDTSATSTAGDTSATSTAGDTSATSTAGSGESALGEIATDPRFSTLTGLLETSGLSTQLATLGPFTLFAPTNDAFAALPAGTLDTLAQNPSLLQQILLYHVAEGAIRSTDITGATTAATAAGEELDISASGGTVTINGTAEVIEADIDAGEGVIHAVDQVLLPPGVALGS